jgi:hypothetical protein
VEETTNDVKEPEKEDPKDIVDAVVSEIVEEGILGATTAKDSETNGAVEKDGHAIINGETKKIDTGSENTENGTATPTPKAADKKVVPQSTGAKKNKTPKKLQRKDSGLSEECAFSKLPRLTSI